MDGWVEGWMGGGMNGWRDGWVGGGMNGEAWTGEGWLDGCRWWRTSGCLDLLLM